MRDQKYNFDTQKMVTLSDQWPYHFLLLQKMQIMIDLASIQPQYLVRIVVDNRLLHEKQFQPLMSHTIVMVQIADQSENHILKADNEKG